MIYFNLHRMVEDDEPDFFELYVCKILPSVAVGIRMRDSSLDLWLKRMMIMLDCGRIQVS